MSPGPLDVLQTPRGALSLAVAVLAAVLGVRMLLARPARPGSGGGRGPNLLAALAYAASLIVTWLGGAGILPASAAPPATVRLAGAALLVFGLLGAGRASREPEGRSAAAERRVLGGLALVLAGQVLRAPSPAGVGFAAVAGAVLAAAAWRAGRGRASDPNG